MPSLHGGSLEITLSVPLIVQSVLPRLVGLGLYQVDVQQGTTASMYGISCTGTQLAFLVKLNPGILVVEGRSSNKELLAAILEQISAALV